MSKLCFRPTHAEHEPATIAGMKPAHYHSEVSDVAVQKLAAIIQKSGETEAHNLLIEYPNLLYFLLPNTGHHGTWYTAKPQICPPLTNGTKGKIPDFLVAGKSSNGLEWFIVELKSPQEKLFNSTGDCFSTVANQGLNQLARYLKYSIEHQSTLRDAYGIRDFRTPKGILVLGNEEETICKEREELKSFWNSSLQNIQIVSYSRILHRAREAVEYWKEVKSKRS
jgi:hypothetical protein